MTSGGISHWEIPVDEFILAFPQHQLVVIREGLTARCFFTVGNLRLGLLTNPSHLIVSAYSFLKS
jgi:hypothetical protein